MLSPPWEQLAVVSLMALARVTAQGSGVECLFAGSAETPCRGWEAACLVEPVEVPCLDKGVVCLIAGLVEMQSLDWESVEVAGGIEPAWE